MQMAAAVQFIDSQQASIFQKSAAVLCFSPSTDSVDSIELLILLGLSHVNNASMP